MWILIVLYMSGGNPAIATAEFSTSQTCLAAAERLQSTKMRGVSQIEAICTPK